MNFASIVKTEQGIRSGVSLNSLTSYNPELLRELKASPAYEGEVITPLGTRYLTLNYFFLSDCEVGYSSGYWNSEIFNEANEVDGEDNATFTVRLYLKHDLASNEIFQTSIYGARAYLLRKEWENFKSSDKLEWTGEEIKTDKSQFPVLKLKLKKV